MTNFKVTIDATRNNGFTNAGAGLWAIDVSVPTDAIADAMPGAEITWSPDITVTVDGTLDATPGNPAALTPMQYHYDIDSGNLVLCTPRYDGIDHFDVSVSMSANVTTNDV